MNLIKFCVAFLMAMPIFLTAVGDNDWPRGGRTLVATFGSAITFFLGWRFLSLIQKILKA
jgi:hypothetical protein